MRSGQRVSEDPPAYEGEIQCMIFADIRPRAGGCAGDDIDEDSEDVSTTDVLNIPHERGRQRAPAYFASELPCVRTPEGGDARKLHAARANVIGSRAAVALSI